MKEGGVALCVFVALLQRGGSRKLTLPFRRFGNGLLMRYGYAGMDPGNNSMMGMNVCVLSNQSIAGR